MIFLYGHLTEKDRLFELVEEGLGRRGDDGHLLGVLAASEHGDVRAGNKVGRLARDEHGRLDVVVCVLGGHVIRLCGVAGPAINKQRRTRDLKTRDISSLSSAFNELTFESLLLVQQQQQKKRLQYNGERKKKERE